MKKNILNVCALAALVMGGVNVAHAASSTFVTVKGSVNTVTCDIASSVADINLGNYLPADFTAAGAFPTGAGKTQDFDINVSGCQGTATAAGQATVKVTGPVTSTGATYFSDDATSQAAVGLALKATPATLVTNGQVLNVLTPGATTAALSNSKLQFTTGLISSVAANTNSGQQITAPLKFEFIYN